MACALPGWPPACGLPRDNAMALLKGPPACGLPGQQRLVVVLSDVLKLTVNTIVVLLSYLGYHLGVHNGIWQ